MMNEIQQVAVLGLGTMGHGIAQTMAVAGCQVQVYDESTNCRETLLERMHGNLLQMAAAQVVEETQIAAAMDRVTVCESETAAVTGAELVTEAIAEDLPIKQSLFQRVESLVAPSTILASNTSSFPITQIATRMQHPDRAVVTHWFNPPHIIPVVEVVPGEKTSLTTTQKIYAFLERIGKLPVHVQQEIPGFLVNRVQTAMAREIWDLLDRGVASAEQIDRAIRGSMGLRLAAIGPLAVADFAGWDVTAQVYQNLIPHQRNDSELPEAIQSLVDQKHYGAKSGQGIYEYPPESVEQQIAARDNLYLRLLRTLESDEPGSVPSDQ